MLNRGSHTKESKDLGILVRGAHFRSREPELQGKGEPAKRNLALGKSQTNPKPEMFYTLTDLNWDVG